MGQIVIRSPNQGERIAPLHSTTFTVGSDLTCDYILFDSGVEGTHLKFSIQKSGIEISALGAVIVCPEGSENEEIEYSPNSTIQWAPSTVLKISNVTIELSDMVVASNSAESKKEKKLFPVKPFLVSVLLFAPIVWGTASYSNLYFTDEVILEEAQSFIQPERTVSEIKEQLVLMGFSVSKVEKSGNQYSVTAYIKDESEGQALKTFTETLSENIRVKAYDLHSIESAVLLVFQALGFDAELQRVEDDKVIISGVSNPNDQKRLARAIVSDVPGVRDVTFSELSGEDTTNFMKGKISAVWAGSNPYVLIEKDKVVFPGEELSEGLVLVSIKSADMLTVSSGQREWEFNWYE